MNDDFSDITVLIHDADRRPYYSGRWAELFGALLVDRARGMPRTSAINELRSVSNDLNSLLTLGVRIDWQDGAMRQGQLPNGLWMQFVGCDVELYHVTLRSLFDHFAHLLTEFASRPGTVPRSFEEVRNWLKAKPSNRGRLGLELAALVENCTWFSDIRAVRDSIVHDGGMPLIFDVSGKPYFQVYQGVRSVVSFPLHTIENDLVDLRAYIAVTMAQLLRYLEAAQPAIRSRASFPAIAPVAIHQHPGYGVLARWLGELRGNLGPAAGAA